MTDELHEYEGDLGAISPTIPLTIDLHTHILPRKVPNFKEKYGYGGFIRLDHVDHTSGCGCKAKMMKDDGTFFREIEDNCWSSRRRIAECNRDGVHVQVLSTVPVMFSYWTPPENGLDVARALNDDLAATVNAHRDRFVGLATLPMQAPDLAAKELRRAVTELGMNGAQIGSHINDMNLNDRAFDPVYQAAQDLDVCLFVHPWDMMGMDRMKKYWLPWLVGMPAETSLAICSMIFGGVFERFPRLRVAFAHGGGAFPSTIGRIEHGWRCRPDLTRVDNERNPRDYCGRFWVDSLVHDPAQLRHLVDLFGDQRVMLGTDYPFPLGEWHPGELIKTTDGLSNESRERMLGLNALEFLGVPADRFLPKST